MDATTTEPPLTPHRDFVLVSQTLWLHYWQRWRDIDRQWRAGFPRESIGTVGYVVAAARDELRAEVRALASKWPPDEGGAYLIPV